MKTDGQLGRTFLAGGAISVVLAAAFEPVAQTPGILLCGTKTALIGAALVAAVAATAALEQIPSRWPRPNG